MRLSLGYQALLAALLGIAVGLFFGPFSNALQPIAEIYFMLLQMVALPYICIALMHGLGSMSPELGKKLLKRGWPIWMTLWLTIFAVIYGLNLLIPDPAFKIIETGPNQGTALAKNFLNYLVPENPLYDLVNNVIPAIVAFGFIFGTALMHLREKEPILSVLQKGTELIEKILRWLALLSPIGIFAHLSVVFGTVSFEDIYTLAFYVSSFIFASLVITIWILPVLLSSMTPLTYGDALKAFKTVCILPFATALPTLSLPFIILYMKKLGKIHHEGKPTFQATSQTVLPICYSFGQIGNCMILFFILFISFYFRHPFTGWEKSRPFHFYASHVIRIVYHILQYCRIFDSATSLSRGSVRAVQASHSHYPKFPSAHQLCKHFHLHRPCFVRLLWRFQNQMETTWTSFGSDDHRLRKHHRSDETHSSPKRPFARGVRRFAHFRRNPATCSCENFSTYPVPTAPDLQDPFERILKQGVLKVGYSLLDVPFSYFNYYGELVGYDIAYAYQLARDLDCTLEFIPIEYDRLNEQIANGEFDIAMSAIVMDEKRLKEMNFTQSYQEQNIVLVVPVNQTAEFMHLKAVESRRKMKIGAYGYYAHAAYHHFPLAEISDVSSPKAFLAQLLNSEVDIAIWSSLQAMTWCLSHPQFVPIDYEGQLGKCYLAYPVSRQAMNWILFLNHWLTLKEQEGFKEKMTRYWLKGEQIQDLPPRWSVIRNVFHWVD